MSLSLKEKLADLPRAPGVYLFRDRHDTIIYVGKAKVLQNRVRSYFQSPDKKDIKTRSLVSNIANLEWIVVRDEVEAFLTEANLIKEHRPRYNVVMKDDKSFPYIQITNEPYPRVLIIRKKNLSRDGHKYYGPYTDAKFVRQTMKVIHKVFPLRTCDYVMTPESVAQRKVKVCLDYHIHQCEGPCEGLMTREDYLKMIHQIEQFLKGRNDDVKIWLQERMKTASETLQFEAAARYRDQLAAVTAFTRKQKKVSADFTDRDILTVACENNYGIGIVMRVRNNLFIGREKFVLTISDEDDVKGNLAQFLRQYYTSTADIPKEILLPEVIDDHEEIAAWLSSLRGNQVSIMMPQRGEKRNLVGICTRNADLLLSELRSRKMKRREVIPKSVRQLQEDLAMKVPPRRIEAFDNSNIQGAHPVAAMACFIDGQPVKREYRHFKIKTVVGADDFESMYEIVFRRYRRVINEKTSLPDLIVIDGGKGQLSAARRALLELELDYVPVIGLAKKLEEVFKPGVSEPQNISKTSPGLFLLRKVRDEVHNAAITYHRKLRGKAMTKSVLDEVPGLGPKRIQRIWQEFKSLDELKTATPEEIFEKTRIPLKTARKIGEILVSTED